MIKLVSIIIPTYARPDNLSRAISSCLNQSYNNIEILVVDDNNPDSLGRKETEELMVSFKEDVRIKYIKHPENKNGAAARNSGIKQAKGKFLSFLDDDDELLVNNIREQVYALEISDENIGAVYCKFKMYDKNEFVFESKSSNEGNLTNEILLAKSEICSSTLLMKKEAIDKIGGFDESFQRHQDWEMLIRFFKYFTIELNNKYLVKRHYDSRINFPSTKKLIGIKVKYLSKFKETIDKSGFKRKIYRIHYFHIFTYCLKRFDFVNSLKYGFKVIFKILYL